MPRCQRPDCGWSFWETALQSWARPTVVPADACLDAGVVLQIALLLLNYNYSLLSLKRVVSSNLWGPSFSGLQTESFLSENKSTPVTWNIFSANIFIRLKEIRFAGSNYPVSNIIPVSFVSFVYVLWLFPCFMCFVAYTNKCTADGTNQIKYSV